MPDHRPPPPDATAFKQGRFRDLPDRPRHAHAFFDTEARELTLESAPFGRHRVAYRTCGSGPPLLLVHGLMTTSYSWRYVLEGFAKRFTVFAPDLPGCGATEVPAHASYAAPSLAAWIGEFQEALGIPGCAAVGNSLGAYLCMRRALEAPDAFSALVNIHSPGLVEPRLRALHLALSLPGAKPALAQVVRRSRRRWVHSNVHYYDETLKSLEEVDEYALPLSTYRGARAFVGYLADALRPADMAVFADELRERRAAGEPFPIPLLLIYSRQDKMVPPRIGEELSALIPSTEMRWLERSSHFAQVDTPEAILDLATGFIAAAAVDHSPAPEWYQPG